MEDIACNHRLVKELLISEIDDIEFHKPKRVNESERVTIKDTRDAAVQRSEELGLKNDVKKDEGDVRDDMGTLYDAATHLRKVINSCKRWVFDGSLETLSKEHYPEELYCFFRWVINGAHCPIHRRKVPTS